MVVARPHSRHVSTVLLVGFGGFLGANLRFSLGAIAGEALVATLLVNTIGSFGLGVLLFDARADEFFSRRSRYIFGTGFFASFTTYSTFVADMFLTEPVVGVIYAGGSYCAGFGGVLVSRWLVGWAASGAIHAPAGDRG